MTARCMEVVVAHSITAVSRLITFVENFLNKHSYEPPQRLSTERPGNSHVDRPSTR